MHVPSNCHGSQRHRWRLPLAMVLMFTIAAFTSSAQAADFDEKLKAPAMKDPAELRSQAQAFSARYRELRQAAPEQLIRNGALARKQFDLRWQILRAIDERKPLEELASLGIVSRGDGSYEVDLREYPEWNDLHETMAGLISRADLAQSAPALMRSGFRPEDVSTLKEYVAAHDPDVAAAMAARPIVLEFGRLVGKFDKLKRPVPDAMVVSFLYQRARAVSESNRLWVEGLFRLLDAQRMRVVMSAFTELDSTTLWIPENTQQGIKDYLAQVRQPDFEARVNAEAKGVAP
jgi:hypothetical protein